MKLNRRLNAVLLISIIAKVKAKPKEPELPICPTNMQFFPSNLPMHCRMPPAGKTITPFPPGFFQSPPPDGLPNPIQFPIPPGFPQGFPGLPPGSGPMPVPGLPGPGPIPMPGPGPMPMPGLGPMPMPMAMPPPGPAHKLPVIVMPFYSPDPSYKNKKRPPRILDHESSSDTSGDSSSSVSREWWRGRRARSGRRSNIRRRSGRGFRKNRKHRTIKRRHNKGNILTPILQYVTKDGYVIFEKKISNNEATDWLSVKKEGGEKGGEPELADNRDFNRNIFNKNDMLEPGEVNADVEILNEDKTKEQDVEVQTHRTPKHFPHKLRSHHNKKEKEQMPS